MNERIRWTSKLQKKEIKTNQNRVFKQCHIKTCKLTLAIGRVPLNLRRMEESIPLGLRQLELRILMKRLLKWRANFFVRFLTIAILLIGVTLVIFIYEKKQFIFISWAIVVIRGSLSLMVSPFFILSDSKNTTRISDILRISLKSNG